MKIVNLKTPYTPKGVEYPYFRTALTFNTSTRPISSAPDTSKTMAVFIPSLMDLQSSCLSHSQRTKTTGCGLRFSSLLEDYGDLGLPSSRHRTLFSGKHRYPRSFGLSFGLCLFLGIEVVFIPIGEPWRMASWRAS